MRNTLLGRLILTLIAVLVIGVGAIHFIVRDVIRDLTIAQEADRRYLQTNSLALDYSSDSYADFFSYYYERKAQKNSGDSDSGAEETATASDADETASDAEETVSDADETASVLATSSDADSDTSGTGGTAGDENDEETDPELEAYYEQLSAIDSELRQYATYGGTTLALVDADGTLILSSNFGIASMFLASLDFSAFGSSYYMVTNLTVGTETEVLTVMYPVNQNYRTVAYVMSCESTETATQTCAEIMNMIYTAYIVIYAFILLFILLLFRLIIPPVRALTRSSQELAKGNLSYEGLKKHPRYLREYQGLADAMNIMAERFSDTEEYQRKFISNISHDFRSPLTSIRGYAEAMLDGTIPPERQERYLNIILSEAERLTRMANGLISLNSWDGTGMHLILTDFDLRTVIKTTLASFEHACLSKHIVIDFSCYAASVRVYADIEKIRQVIYNLMDNAIKFSPQDGTIYLDVSEKGEKVFVSIKDHGIGIPKAALPKIWDRFYKADNSRGRDRMGSGLGLAIVKEILQAHKEQIDVVSTEGAGTEFIFTLTKSKK